MKERIEKCLAWKLNTESINNFDAHACPPGWRIVLEDFISVIRHRLRSDIESIVIDKGLLRAKVHVPVGTDVSSRIVKWLTTGLARESAVTCMITGKRGHRRKEYPGWPCLSTQVLIEYANELDEEKRNKNE